MTILRNAAVAAGIIVVTAGHALAASTTVTGTVTDIFGQRYVVDEGSQKALVDLGPKGRDAVTIKSGDKITVEGEMTPAGEIHAATVRVGDQAAVELPESRTWWQKMTGMGKDDDKTPFGPVEAKAEVEKAGYEPVGEPEPDKKHFALLAKKDGKFYEVHAHRSGEVKQIRTVEASDPRWGTLVK